MSKLVERLALEPENGLLSIFSNAEQVALDYQWELKGGRERAYVELSIGDLKLRSSETTLVQLPEEAYPILVHEARSVREYLSRIVAGFNLDFKGYYLKGWKQEEALGSLLED